MEQRWVSPPDGRAAGWGQWPRVLILLCCRINGGASTSGKNLAMIDQPIAIENPPFRVREQLLEPTAAYAVKQQPHVFRANFPPAHGAEEPPETRAAQAPPHGEG